MSTEIIGQISQQPLQVIGNISSNTEIKVEIMGSGATGKDGADGRTPVKGLDYFTLSEKAEIINDCVDSVIQDVNYVHDQIASSKVWTIIHNLNKYPSVTVIDTVSNLVIGDINYVSNNEIILTFSYPFSGKAFLN